MGPEGLGRRPVVPKGVRHRLKSDKGDVVLDFEVQTMRRGTINDGAIIF